MTGGAGHLKMIFVIVQAPRPHYDIVVSIFFSIIPI